MYFIKYLTVYKGQHKRSEAVAKQTPSMVSLKSKVRPLYSGYSEKNLCPVLIGEHQ